MQCRYVKPMENENAVALFQERLGIRLDDGYVDFIKKNNGGRPDRNLIVCGGGTEKVVNKFLSFNETDKDNVFKARRRTEGADAELVPFASDPSGNYFCFKAGGVFYYDHEEEEIQPVADSFKDFLDMLKE